METCVVRRTGRRLLCLCLAFVCLCLPVRALAPDSLIPVGETVGIEMKMGGVAVVGFASDPGPAQAAGVQIGDIIDGIDGAPIASAEDFLQALSKLQGETITLDIRRDGERVSIPVQPEEAEPGCYRLGLWLRDGVAGIGTMTFYDPDSGSYGALGHGISDEGDGSLVEAADGEIVLSEIVDVIPGGQGSPGELCGKLDREQVLGSVERNTDAGIFGKLWHELSGQALPVATEDEICLGPATILSNVTGREVHAYTVEITRLYHDEQDKRCMMLQVTDEELLGITGGIVQGMSGSPIVQNGKLIGAVTHVLISDPSRGYGISMEKMLQAA